MELERYFRGLSDPSRLRIINLLLHGELCGCDILYVLATSQPNVVVDRRDGFRIFYRLADPRKGVRRQLFEFLRQAFREESVFRQDVERLRQAIKEGDCTVSDWQPYSALTRIRPSTSSHASER
jgi:ArsR family transcriptional regulator, arsenate/arsenite/antimonite-responsive transcriptional repressor